MNLAIKLANKAGGFQLPNPKVGCVIVNKNEILGRGYHQIFGKNHAEINAIEDANKNNKSLIGATLYVTLTPCSKFGKTGPCVDQIIKSKIKKVIIASTDISDFGAIDILKKHNIEVITDVLKNKADLLNQSFFWNIQNTLPYVVVKIATSIDGYLATRSMDSKWITSEKTRFFARKNRGNYQAILIGATTLKKDNPKLNIGVKNFKDPIVVILTNHIIDWKQFQLFEQDNPKIIFTTEQNQYTNIPFTDVIFVNSANINANFILKKLWEMGIKSILVEGGSYTYTSFFKTNNVNELHVYYGNKLLGDSMGLRPFDFRNTNLIGDALTPKLLQIKKINDDIFCRWRVK